MGRIRQPVIHSYGYKVAAIFIAIVCLLTSSPSFASPWPQENNALLVISRVEYFDADLGAVNTLNGIVDSRFERIETNTYLEFGLTDKITIGGKAIYGTSWLTRGNVAEVATGFSEIEIFSQHQIFRNDVHVGSIKISGAIPANFSSGTRPALRSDSVDVGISALYGRNLNVGALKIFTSLEGGYKKRFGSSAELLRLESTIGIEPSNSLLILLESFSQISVQNETAAGADFDIFKIQPSIVWRATKRFGFQAGVTEEVAGRNIALGRTVFVGLWSVF